jgi:hypothetical protein
MDIDNIGHKLLLKVVPKEPHPNLFQYEALDKLHYKVENELLRLIESVEQKDGQWEDRL